MKEKVLQVRMESQMRSQLQGLAEKAGFSNISEYVRYILANKIEKEQNTCGSRR